jgi:hypothetical protein
MRTTSGLFSPLKNALLAFFKHDVTLRRSEGQVRLVLEDRLQEPTPKAPSRAEQAAQRDARALALAREELARVLDDDPRLRSTARHLAFVEHALEKKGWRGLYKVPLDVLQKALAQLEDLVMNWSPEGLASLRSKMAVAVIDREHNNPEAEADAYRTAAILDNPPQLAAQAIDNAKASAEDEDAALRAAYEAMGMGEPGTEAAIEMHGELGSRSAQGLARSAARGTPVTPPVDIRLRDLQT